MQPVSKSMPSIPTYSECVAELPVNLLDIIFEIDPAAALLAIEKVIT